MNNEKKEKKMRVHKRIYIFLLILTIISFADIATRSFIAKVFQDIDSDIGIFGLLVISITQNPIVIGVSFVLLDVGLFILLIALFERQTYKKIEKELNVSQKMNEKT